MFTHIISDGNERCKHNMYHYLSHLRGHGRRNSMSSHICSCNPVAVPGGAAALRPSETATLRAPRGSKASWSNHLGEGLNAPGLGISSHMNGTWPRRGWRARCWGATLQGADVAALAGARVSMWVTEGLTLCVCLCVRVCVCVWHC